MNIVIRTDASLEIGTGHVMRCVTLAKQLEREGANITFICRNFPGNSISFIQGQGFHVHPLVSYENQKHWQWMRRNWKRDAAETKLVIKELGGKVDLLIVDHYGIDTQWESELRSATAHIMVIDDLANRSHDCDLLLDQNYYLSMQKRYKGLVSDSCIQLLGPNYVLLREEFLSINIQKIKRDGKVNNILVFFGGTDPTEETMKTLKAIEELAHSAIEINVVVGIGNPQKEMIEQVCSKMPNALFRCQVNNMAELMVNADLAIGAGGTTSWERCYLGLPTIVIVVADNQKEVTNAIEENGAILCLGESAVVTESIISKAIHDLCNKPVKVKEMVQNCWEIVDPKVARSQLVIKNVMRLLK